MADAITRSWHGDVLVVDFDDGRANALGWEALEGLEQALDDTKDARALVISGRPGRFCAGFDLEVVRTDRALELMGRGGELALRLWELPIPIVFAVTGHALAMGAVLLGCADYRVGSDGNFKIGLNEVRINLAVPPFAAEIARARLDPRFFHRATVLAEIFDPAGALEAGYLDEVVAADDTRERALDLATAWAGELQTGAFRATRRIIRGELGARLRELLGTETAAT